MAAACFAAAATGSCRKAPERQPEARRRAAQADAGPGARARPDPGALAGWDELSFVPRDVEALARVDVRRMGEADPGFAALLPATLQHERPDLLALMSLTGIDLVADVDRVYFALGKDFAKTRQYLLASAGTFEAGPVEAALRRHKLETLDVHGLTVFRFRAREGNAGIVVAPGLIVVGALPLVEASAALLAGAPGEDVRSAALAEELAAVDPSAHAFAVAALTPSTRAELGQEAAGLQQMRFEVTRVAGRAALTLHMVFDGRAAAEAAETRVRALTQGAERVVPALGIYRQSLDATVKIAVEGTALTARAVL